jgi:putative transposase
VVVKWLKRYQLGQKDWYRDQSKAPRSSPKRIPEVEKQSVIEVRKRLENERFSQIGISAIKWELSKSGHNLPSDRTINRILKREELVKKNSIRSQGT